MSRKALGLIETMGLVAAYGAADAALKAADVSLIGFDFPGNGGTLVKIEGNVAAVTYAVDVGTEVAEKIYKVLSHHVITKPNDETDPVVRVKSTVLRLTRIQPKKSRKKSDG